MKDDLDIMRQCRQLYAQGNALARRFHMLSDNVKVTIFRSYCSSLKFRVFPRNNKVWAHGPMSMKFDGPFL